MEKAQILIVEDDGIIAMDIESRLKSFGYSVPGIVSYGEDVIKKVEECRPDLVFMDIVLKGEIDGIEAADQIRTQFNIPVIFLTAHADEERLERAKLTQPFGYILKPFQDKELKATIEMALYTSKVDAARKQSEEALTTSEMFLNATGRIAKVGGWQVDGETKKVFWTKEIYNITEVPNDYDPSSLEKDAIVFFSAEDQIRLEKAFQRAFENNEPYDMEFQITTAKGNKKWTQAICEPFVVDGKVVKLGGTFQDITERKQAEETLRESENRFRQLAEGTFEAIVLHEEGIILHANDQYYEMFGYEPHEVSGKDAIALTTTPDSLQLIRKQISLGNLGPYEVTGLKKGGIEFPMEISVKVTEYHGRKIRMAAIRDLTNRKKAEKELEIKAKDLEELNAALKVLLDKRQEDQEEFQEGILTNIRALIEPYLDKLKKSKLTQNQKTLLNIIESNLNEIISPFTKRLSSQYLNLTTKEIKIANLVKHEKTNKEIAEIQGVTSRTIAAHRENIRKKLGLTNKKINLKTYLMSIN